MATSSDDWLAAIDLTAVKPTGPRKTTKAKKKRPPHKRIKYTTGAALAPSIPSWAKSIGPDQQRPVREVAGKFIPSDEVCTILSAYSEALEIFDLIEHSSHPNKDRLLHIMQATVAPYEFAEAQRLHDEDQKLKGKEFDKFLHETFAPIVKDETNR